MKSWFPVYGEDNSMDQNKSDYEIYLSLLQNANIKHVTTKGDFPESLYDNLYIATYASYSDSIITVHQFKESGKLCDIAPTLLDLAGIDQPKSMTGHSLVQKA